jgi:hypothetical protein
MDLLCPPILGVPIRLAIARVHGTGAAPPLFRIARDPLLSCSCFAQQQQFSFSVGKHNGIEHICSRGPRVGAPFGTPGGGRSGCCVVNKERLGQSGQEMAPGTRMIGLGCCQEGLVPIVRTRGCPICRQVSLGCVLGVVGSVN